MSLGGSATYLQEGEVVLRDLQGLLRKFLDEQVIVVNFTTSTLLPKGENYGSTILKVEAVIKRSKESSEENLSLVAKMISLIEFQKIHLNNTSSFMKEIYVFEKLIPSYRALEKESGIKDKDLFDILPKYYGGRLNRNQELLNEADEDAVLLMENLKVRHFHSMNRQQGLDYYHAKQAIDQLARFHALGRALKYKNPAFFEEATKIINVSPFKMSTNEFNDIVQHLINMICTDSRIAKYKDRLQNLIDIGCNFITPSEISEPWITFAHGDFWVNNIMFQEESSNIKNIKFVDFQLMKLSSPLNDIPYFICGSVDINTINEHFDDLLDTYYTKFIKVLNSVHCDVSPFTRKTFDENLKLQGQAELLHCLLAVKFFTIEISNELNLDDLKSSIIMKDASNLFLDRSYTIISKFIEKEWI
ncbi:PREDICTED: uncharacterized protein LOC105362673 [Ceratosolen solmsi marchali]|uniref:Uncharacterized protein LOC105362673 n=1 Tax=Ceratosolen solmsi marchali TaxID=326594 RepID=A0AAJ6YI30_9HYME|nr:PREDICTED: uncharacterized protein LOC105362673 [Ceratosolen solmsi marchali]